MVVRMRKAGNAKQRY